MPDCPVCGFNNKTGKRGDGPPPFKQKKFFSDSDWRWHTFHNMVRVTICVGALLLYYAIWTASDITFWGRSALFILIAGIGYVSLHLGPDVNQFSVAPGFLSSLVYLAAVYILILTSSELSNVGVIVKLLLATLIAAVGWVVNIWVGILEKIIDTLRSWIYGD